MLFNSYEFIFLFLPLAFFIYFYLNKKRLTEASKGFLIAASLFFYSWWNIAYLPLILISMLFNYTLGSALSKKHIPRRVSKKQLLIIGIAANLGLLGYFKYVDFFLQNINLVTNTHVPLLHLALPLAISFFTFQQIAYLVDSYRQETYEYDFLNYAIFVTFFPQLIAGPIVHHKEMMPQFANTRNKVMKYKNVALGIAIFSLGLFKKVVIADSFSVWATNGFDMAGTLNFIEAWSTSLAYTFQLYFDFSGYTDMAIGSALLFNIKLPLNFDSPYKAVSIQDFWRRWHMTLSRFLKDYIYIPLGGNRRGDLRTYENLMITFLLGGLWHGAGWTFVFWGFLHGLALIIHRIWHKSGMRLHAVAAWLVTFLFINFTWVFFRAKEWEDALKVLKGMVSIDSIVLPEQLSSKLDFMSNYGIAFSDGFLKHIHGDAWTLIWVVLFIPVVALMKNSNALALRFKNNVGYLMAMVLIFTYSVLAISDESEFLYFNF